MLNKLSDEESQKLLERNRLGRLSCVLENGEPYVVPVNYLFENGSLYVHSLRGQKISALRSNPKLCLQTDEISDDELEWKSVIAFGEFDEVKNAMERQRHLDRFYEAFPRFTPVEAKLDKKEAAGDVVIFRVNISRMTGLAEIY